MVELLVSMGFGGLKLRARQFDELATTAAME
jgi:hypothetical protein